MLILQVGSLVVAMVFMVISNLFRRKNNLAFTAIAAVIAAIAAIVSFAIAFVAVGFIFFTLFAFFAVIAAIFAAETTVNKEKYKIFSIMFYVCSIFGIVILL